MDIAFIDPARAYSAGAPWQGPLGGTQSACCYLAIALAAQGHRVTLYNHITEVTEAHRTIARPWMQLFDGAAADHDALVLVGRWTAEMVGELIRFRRPLYGWMHEAAFDAQWIVPDPRLTGIVFVSDWQRRVNAPALGTIAGHVIRNGISPFAEALAKAPLNKNPQCAIFAGDAVRGLVPLVEIWPQLYARDPRLTLKIYSDPLLQGVSPEIAASFQAKVMALPGLAHIGKVGQEALARAMARATYHLSPNPYPETSCITLLEALALGCRSIITARAALPESAHGFATLAPVADADNHRRNAVPVDTAAFVAAFHAPAPHDPAAQQAHILAQHSWDRLARDWIGLLS